MSKLGSMVIGSMGYFSYLYMGYSLGWFFTHWSFLTIDPSSSERTSRSIELVYLPIHEHPIKEKNSHSHPFPMDPWGSAAIGMHFFGGGKKKYLRFGGTGWSIGIHGCKYTIPVNSINGYGDFPKALTFFCLKKTCPVAKSRDLPFRPRHPPLHLCISLLFEATCFAGNFGIEILPSPEDPWDDWYIYLHGWLIFMGHVGKYTSPMDPQGRKQTQNPSKSGTFRWLTTWKAFCALFLRQ